MSIPKDKNFGFVEYEHECSVDYAIQLYKGTALFGQELQLKRRNQNKTTDANGRQQQPPRMQHNQSLPNVIQRFPPLLNVYRPPAFGFSPINPTFNMQPINPMLIPSMNRFPHTFPFHAGPPHVDIPLLPLPPGESPSYPFHRSQQEMSRKRGHHNEHDDRDDHYHPGEKKSR